MDYRQVILRLIERENLSFEEAEELFNVIMEGGLNDIQIAAILVSLRMKGETEDEIAGAASVMRKKSRKVMLGSDLRRRIVDTCGTGGDLKGTFNVSTATALVVASCNVPVAKHGNRSVSSRCGSADILEAFGVKIELEPEQVAKCIERTNFGFMFAPKFHPAMAFVARTRKELGIRTVFNILGPLTNPAGALKHLMGVYDGNLTEKIAKVLLKLGVERAFVVHGEDGTDEVTVCDATKVTEVSKGDIKTYIVYPEDFGFNRASFEDIMGGETLEENVEILRRVLKGEDKSPKRDMLVLNSAFALLAAGAVSDVNEGINLAIQAVEAGRPYEKLCQVVRVSHEV